MKQFTRRKRNKESQVQWSRKAKPDGTIRYTFIYYDDYWVIKVSAETARSRPTIARMLVAQRRKFRRVRDNFVHKCGGIN